MKEQNDLSLDGKSVKYIGVINSIKKKYTKKNTPALLNINSITNYTEVYQMVKKLQKDIYSDIMYPNDLRPSENHGYKTKYRGFDK